MGLKYVFYMWIYVMCFNPFLGLLHISLSHNRGRKQSFLSKDNMLHLIESRKPTIKPYFKFIYHLKENLDAPEIRLNKDVGLKFSKVSF